MAPLWSVWEQTRPADDDPCCHRLPSLNHGEIGRGRREQFCVFQFIFNSKVGTAVCRSCRYVTTNIWEMSRSWLGVGRSCKHPQDSVPISPPEPSYLTDILDLYLGYLGRILTISLPYILGLSHFLNTFNTVQQQVSFVGWKYRPCREKKLEIALLNKTVFKVKFKFEGKNCALQISAHQFFGWNIWQSSTRPFFLTFCSEIKKKSKICFFQPRQIYLEYLGAIKMRDKDKISIWNIWLWIKWETKFQNSYCLLSIGLNL